MSGLLNNERGGAVRWIIIIIIVAASVFAYQHFKRTPRYALIQFKRFVMFSNAETTQQYIDLDRVIRHLPDSVTRKEPDEAVKKRFIYELNSASEKVFFQPVRDWSVIMVPIAISQNRMSATAEPIEGTKVTLEKEDQDRWIITSLRISE